MSRIVDFQDYPSTSTPVNATNLNAIQDGLSQQIKTQEFTFSDVSYTAGTIGTRGYSSSTSVSLTGYTPISATCSATTSSANYIITPILQNNTLYCIAYRTKTTAQTAQTVKIRVAYMKN